MTVCGHDPGYAWSRGVRPGFGSYDLLTTTGPLSQVIVNQYSATHPAADANRKCVPLMTVCEPGNDRQRHVPVLVNEVVEALSPRDGDLYVDGTFGAGGYASAVLEAADCTVIGIDRDRHAIAGASELVKAANGRTTLIEGRFGDMADLLARHGISHVDGVMLDIGVSSMQLDEAARGFSFMRDGPLDMRMEQSGPDAADVVNTTEERHLRRIIAILGEEKRAHTVVKAIVRARGERPFSRTLELADVIEKALGRPPRGHAIHPATRTFQALRIYVNGELQQLAAGLSAAETVLAPGGRLVVVTFHSLEDRIVKRFFAERSGHVPRGSRHAPPGEAQRAPSFVQCRRAGVTASDGEVAANPRARSARLRAGERTAAPAFPFDPAQYGVAGLELGSAGPC